MTPIHALTAAAVLARAREATFSRPVSTVASIRIQSAIVAVGLHGTSDEWDDLRNGRFAQFLTGPGPIAGANGWDGSEVWDEDASGVVHIDGGQSGRIQAIDQAYVDTYGYFKPNAGGAPLTLLGQRKEGNVAFDVLQITPPKALPLQFWFDRRTHLLAKISGTIGLISSTIALSNYHRVDGIAIPFDVSDTVSNGNNTTATVTAVSLNVPGIAQRLQVPPYSAHDFSIAGASSTTVPIQLINNHIYVHVMLDGKGPYMFVFDTGGTYIVTPQVAAVLGAQSSGGAQLQGVGAKSESAQFTRINNLQIGNASIEKQDFLVLPIGQGFGVAEGITIDGMIGYEVAARFLTSIDYANQTMTLTMPGAQQPPGTPISFYFDSTIPRVPITVNGIQADAELDTGNRAAFDLFSPFVAGHPQIASAETTADGVTGFGVGGPSFGKLGRVNLTIGPYTLDDVVTGFSTQTTGATADPFTPANIGGGLWDRFILTLDYPHQRIYLQPNASYGTPFTYDRSGLFIIDYNGGVMVLDARAGTPAALAGLKKGDVILSVNGTPASSLTLAQIRAFFMQAPGTTIRLHVRSGTAERDVTFALRDYV
jgi:membrane-associated protease RseP (regulator of RpoE activity)